ncbi:LOW QUALITY PROTEIN: activator of 90 kDa heat shock protein ATPase homolog 2-like [Lynx rufus]|uniref:LOW QUALITY PROTEIN: activator of 90 kDa heat shock protein ATPase homolog 2-like n=1 Tax=Lynx rufus TaxID=61384 RepID=UPI001F127037|nr:LOW QUALITY PROTEIN: activator of 90 kDa heat shock protein ATPase homolog 2-like [Lynx rufus]
MAGSGTLHPHPTPPAAQGSECPRESRGLVSLLSPSPQSGNHLLCEIRLSYSKTAARGQAEDALPSPLVLFSSSSEPQRCVIKESGAKHKGLIEILSLSEENEVDDTEMNVSKKKGDGDIRKDLMKTAGTAKLSFGTSTLLEIQASSPMGLGVRIPTVTLHMTELFDPTVEQLYSIFTVKDLVQKFSKSLAILEAEKGGTFQMFDGNITGEYVELLTNKKIVMKWRHRNWPEEHHATVALNFVPTPGQTELQLDCKGVPVCKEEGMKSCWQKQHFEEIKCLLKLTTLNG